MKAALIECVGSAFPSLEALGADETQGRIASEVVSMLRSHAGASVWRVRVGIMTAAGAILQKIAPGVATEAIMHQLTAVLDIGGKDPKFHQVRLATARALVVIIERGRKNAEYSAAIRIVLPQLRSIIRLLTLDTDPETAQRASVAQKGIEKLL